jgi:hypothetical protein
MRRPESTMKERADVLASTSTAADHGGRLDALCAAVADLRRELASGIGSDRERIDTRLAAIGGNPARQEFGSAKAVTVLALLDELDGLTGQLELECAAMRARIATLDRHRQARATYDQGFRRQ